MKLVWRSAYRNISNEQLPIRKRLQKASYMLCLTHHRAYSSCCEGYRGFNISICEWFHQSRKTKFSRSVRHEWKVEKTGRGICKRASGKQEDRVGHGLHIRKLQYVYENWPLFARCSVQFHIFSISTLKTISACSEQEYIWLQLLNERHCICWAVVGESTGLKTWKVELWNGIWKRERLFERR